MENFVALGLIVIGLIFIFYPKRKKRKKYQFVKNHKNYFFWKTDKNGQKRTKDK
jgi:LPXTG-motif cell wall-anchored protein